jgi:acetylornithine deacetylase/succinyl-diaminopimelate desuccinylase-like protein
MHSISSCSPSALYTKILLKSAVAAAFAVGFASSHLGAATVISPPAPSPPPAVREQARAILGELIGIDTTHARGTTEAAQRIVQRLRDGGFSDREVSLITPEPGKSNVVVSYPGASRGKPVVYLAHLDVVEANAEDWSVPPFQLTEKDGVFYGRGVYDVKGEVANAVVSLLRLKAEHARPRRGIVVAFTSDEESGGTLNGVDWLLRHRPELLAADFVVNLDSGGGLIAGGRRAAFGFQTAEKYYATFDLEVTDFVGGHSSLPKPENAIYRLAAGLDRWAHFQFAPRASPTTRAYFSKVAASQTGQIAQDMRAISRGELQPAAVERVSHDTLSNAILRTTCVATQLQAGHAESALPLRAAATIQCRIEPDQPLAEVRDTLVRVLDDPKIAVKVRGDPAPSPESPMRPDVLKSVESVVGSLWPGVPVVPNMDPWASDSYYLRKSGITAYGISGIFTDVDVGSHGKDEHILVAEYYGGVEFLYRLMKELAR